MLKVSLFNQGDSRWKDKQLLPSKWTMGNSGCYITSLTMALPNFSILHEDGTPLTPGDVLKVLIANGGLNDMGLMTYDGMEKSFPWLDFNERIYTTNDPSSNGVEMKVDVAINKVRRYLDLGQPIILSVDNIYNDGIPDHAILAHDYVLDASGKVVDFLVHDPDGGHAIKFTDKYGPLEKGLYGYVGIIGPPVEFPDQSTDKEDGTAVWKASMVRKGINVKTYTKEIIDAILSV